jgi:hypothetical protein
VYVCGYDQVVNVCTKYPAHEPVLKKGAVPIVFMVVIPYVGIIQAMHKFRYVEAPWIQMQVYVIAHQAITVQTATVFLQIPFK